MFVNQESMSNNHSYEEHYLGLVQVDGVTLFVAIRKDAKLLITWAENRIDSNSFSSSLHAQSV